MGQAPVNCVDAPLYTQLNGPEEGTELKITINLKKKKPQQTNKQKKNQPAVKHSFCVCMCVRALLYKACTCETLNLLYTVSYGET